MIHRDIKGQNVLLTENAEVKLGMTHRHMRAGFPSVSVRLRGELLNNHTVMHTYINDPATSGEKTVVVLGCKIVTCIFYFFLMFQLTLESQHSSTRRSVDGIPSSVLHIGWRRRSSHVMRTLRPHMITGYFIMLGCSSFWNIHLLSWFLWGFFFFFDV